MLKILELEKHISKKYKNLERKQSKRYKQNIEELNQTLDLFWKKRMYYIKCPVYKYDKMNKENKEKLVKVCLSNNMLEFKKYHS